MTENYGHLDVTAPYFCSYCGDVHEWTKCSLKGICRFCKERPATLHFGDMLSLTHGGGENCCAICCAEKQLDFARERAAAIPELEAEVARLHAGDAA